MLGLIVSLVIAVFAVYFQKFSMSDAFLASAGFMMFYYILMFATGTAARFIILKNEIWGEKILLATRFLFSSHGLSIFITGWPLFITGEAVYIVASALLFFSGSFGSTFYLFNPWLFFGGLMLLATAITIQRITIRLYEGGL